MAVKIADSEGLDAVSMRRLAAEMGSGAASLYRYVKSKEELLDLMVDAVVGEDKLPRITGEWRADLVKVALQSRAMILRHPWLISLSAFRSSLGPNVLGWLEFTLKVIDGLGLDIDEMAVLSNTLYAFARGYAAGEVGELEASRRSGMTRKQWMDSRAHITRALVASGKYPMFTRVVKDARAPHDPRAAEHGFRSGLEHILDGFAVRIGKRPRARGLC